MENWLLGLNEILRVSNILLILLGVFIGLTFASLPGLSNTTALVLMIPFVYEMDPIPAIIFLVAIYGGGIHGGCILAILFRIPGEAQAVCTTFDGSPMADQGKGAEAMGIAFTYSTLGGLFGVIICILFAPTIARWALSFGPAEYFAFIFFGLCVASTIGSANIAKGLLASCFGLLLGCIGVSASTGVFRYTGGIEILHMGIQYVPIIMGVFAIAQLVEAIAEGRIGEEGTFAAPKWMVKLPSFAFFRKTFRTFLRSAAVGTFIGFLPGAGATAASFVAYGLEVNASSTPEVYGKGEPRGVIAPEAANNASYGGAMVPMMTMGIPGSAATAIMLSALMLKGISPSPEVFNGMPNLVYSVFIAMILVQIAMFAESIFFGRVYLNMVKMPHALICLSVLALCTVGTFAIRSAVEDVFIMGMFAVIGTIMRRLGYPVASLVLGVILADMAESTFIQAIDSNGKFDLSIFFTSSWISCSLMLIGIACLLWPLVKAWKKQGEPLRA